MTHRVVLTAESNIVVTNIEVAFIPEEFAPGSTPEFHERSDVAGAKSVAFTEYTKRLVRPVRHGEFYTFHLKTTARARDKDDDKRRLLSCEKLYGAECSSLTCRVKVPRITTDI